MAPTHIATNAGTRNNVLSLPPPFGKTRPRAEAGEFLLPVVAHTDLLGGDVLQRQYRVETLTVDPDFDLDQLEPATLIVGQFSGGGPHLMSFDGWTGRASLGQFVKSGDPSECYLIGPLRVGRNEASTVFRIIGVLVGEPRRLPVWG